MVINNNNNNNDILFKFTGQSSVSRLSQIRNFTKNKSHK